METLIIVNDNDEIVGRELRKLAHEKHLLHRSVHVVIATSDNRILLQMRKAARKQYPLYWGGSVAGHVSADEPVLHTAMREMEEEIGIETEIEFVGKHIVDDEFEHELVYTYFGRSDGPFKFQHSEIKAVEFFNVEELKLKYKEMKLTPQCRWALEKVFDKYF